MARTQHSIASVSSWLGHDVSLRSKTPKKLGIPSKKKKSARGRTKKTKQKPTEQPPFVWNADEMLKKWKQASTVPFLTKRLLALQSARTHLMKTGSIDQALAIQQGIQKLQLRIEKLKREKKQSTKSQAPASRE